MESNEDSPSRPAKKDAKPSYSGSNAQPSGRSPDSHRSYQGGDRQGYRSDRGSQGGYRSDRPQGQSSGYRSDRAPSSGGYRSDRGSSGGYRSDRPQGQSSGYRSDRSSQGGYHSDRPQGGYRSDRPQDTVLTGHPLPGATVRTADSRASLRDIARTERLHREDTVPTDPPKASLPEAIAPTVPREGPPTLPSAVSGLSTEIRPLSARISRVKTPAMPARVLLPIPATMPTTRRQA